MAQESKKESKNNNDNFNINMDEMLKENDWVRAHLKNTQNEIDKLSKIRDNNKFTSGWQKIIENDINFIQQMIIKQSEKDDEMLKVYKKELENNRIKKK